MKLTLQNALLACGALLALLSLVPNRAASEGLDGVWQGTIGKIKVQLCLQDGYRTGGNVVGAYYALSDGVNIPLDPEDSSAEDVLPDRWKEATGDGEDATLTFRLQDANHLIGERLGKNPSPIALQRVPYLISEYADPRLTSCGSLTFSAPLIAEGARTRVIPSVRYGRRYSRLILAPAKLDFRLESFQIPGKSSVVKKINATLAEGFPGLDPEVEVTDILDCARSNLDWSGRGGLNIEIRWPEILIDTILVIGTSYDVYCGGAYPEMSTTWQVINLETGEELDPRTWLLGDTLETLLYGGPSNIDADLAVPGEPSFYEVFLQHYPGTPTDGGDCVDLLSTYENWFIRPSQLGIVFTQDLPHVVQACAVDVTIPYAQIWPFLSEPGKKVATEVLKVMQGND